MTEVRLEGMDGKYLRPVFYSDNFFALLPGERKRIVADHPSVDCRLVVRSWNSR